MSNSSTNPTPLRSLFSLQGMGIGLTGGGGHLGKSMTLALAAQGATVLIMGRTLSKLKATAEAAKDLPGEVLIYVGDVQEPEQIEGALDAIIEKVGAVHGWINNAYSGAGGRLLEVDREAVEHCLTGGLTNLIMATQHVAKRMIKSGGGSIVNVSSMYGIVSPDPVVYQEHPQFHNPPAYGAAKAGVIQFSRYAACDLGMHNIRVNTLSPGAFPSPPVQQEQSFIDVLAARSPLGRIGKPEELGGALVFLLSKASSFMTGQNLVIDGGWTAW